MVTLIIIIINNDQSRKVYFFTCQNEPIVYWYRTDAREDNIGVWEKATALEELFPCVKSSILDQVL